MGTKAQLVGIVTGFVLVGAVSAAYVSNEDNEIILSRRDYGRLGCKTLRDNLVVDGVEKSSHGVWCDLPPGVVRKTGPRFMETTVAIERAAANRPVQCNWVLYRAVRVWPPGITIYHAFEDCDLEYHS
jgi:hypothetical protein